MTKAEFHRAVVKLIHQHGEPLADGRIGLDVEAFSSALVQLDGPAPKAKTDDELEEGDELEGYDPAKEGKEMAKKQIGERERAKNRFR